MLLAMVAPACVKPVDSGRITVYSGRSEGLVGQLLNQFSARSSIGLDVRYGDSAELAAALIDEGPNTRADLFFSQDAGSLGALAKAGRLARLPSEVMDKVDRRFRSPDSLWIGTSGRARTLVFNPEKTDRAQLPDSVEGLAGARWKARVGWAPPNASFQSFVTAFRALRGDNEARRWLSELRANGTRRYPNNAAIVKAVAAGEIEAGLVNHYYAFELRRQDPSLSVENHFFRPGDPGNLINVAGVGIINSERTRHAGRRLVDFLLSVRAQSYFSAETFEYPLAAGVAPDPLLPPLESIGSPDIDLSDLAGLQETVAMLKETGLL